MILVVTGSRDANEILATEVIREQFADLPYDVDEVWHGDCPTGADFAADQYVRNTFDEEMRPKVVKFPADWKALGKAAGPRRNARMMEAADADSRMVRVLAIFAIGAGNVGTMGCVGLAVRHCLPVDIRHVAKRSGR